MIAMALFFSCTYAIAQTEFDASKYIQTDINGTARYMSMAGAFGALGGDASAIKDNPAGLGIYRKSEIVGTMNTLMQNSTSNWKFTDNNLSKNSYGYGDMYKIGANNFSFVLATPTLKSESGTNGLQSSNWSFSYNRLKNFDRNINIKSGASQSSMTDYLAYFSEGFYAIDLQYGRNINELFDNPNIPTLSVYGYQGFLMDSVSKGNWLSSISNKVTPSYQLLEKGHLDEYSIGWAGNFSNVFFLGATINYQALNYTAISKYSETFGSEGNMNIGDTLYTKGNGVNLNIGMIACPTDNIRLGLSLHTPTIFSLTDDYYSTLVYTREKIVNMPITGPAIRKYYQFQNPMQLNASIAYILGTKGLISAEYVYNNYTGSRLMSDSGNSQDYSDENDGMKQVLNDVRTIKIGAEYKLTNNFSLRAGYANTNNGTKPDAEKLLQLNTKRVDVEYFLQNNTNYFTAGFGYREASWFIDFAYMNKILDETFYPYRTSVLANKANPASVITNNNNAVITLGLKF